MKNVKSPQITYKSKYSIVCDLVGHPKPKTQEEEDYCQQTELETDTPKHVIAFMLIEYLLKFQTKDALLHIVKTTPICQNLNN